MARTASSRKTPSRKKASDRKAPKRKTAPKTSKSTKPAESKAELLALYRQMLLIRRFEEKAGQLYGQGSVIFISGRKPW